MRGFIEYWPAVILRKMTIVFISKYMLVIKDIIKIRYRHSKILKFFKIKPTTYEIQESMIFILRNTIESFLYGFVTPIIIPLSALCNFAEMVCCNNNRMFCLLVCFVFL